MVNCNVVSDLMVVYASGEASPATQALVENHLAHCATCREAFGKEEIVEDTLANMERGEEPPDGRQFITRTRRLLFAISAGILVFFACVLAGLERIVMEGIAGIPLLDLPGSSALWLALAATMVGLYLALLFWRSARGESAARNNLLVSLSTAIPLLLVGLAAYHLARTGSAASVAIAGLLWLSALGATFVLLPRLSHATLTTLLILLLLNSLLVGQAVLGVVAVGDFSWQTPAQLGHPAEDSSVQEAMEIDLTALGLDRVQTRKPTTVDGVEIDSGAEVAETVYNGDGHQALITGIRFDDRHEADEFFTTWKESVSGRVRITHVEINLPSLAEQGSVFRTYEPGAGRAYSAWQVDNWVTIIQVPGAFSQAMPLAQEVKETVTRSYK